VPCPRPDRRDPERDVVGCVSLGLAVIGSVLGIVPTARTVGWVLLVAAFVTGSVGVVHQKTALTSPALAGLILSVVGVVVSLMVLTMFAGDGVVDTEVSGDRPSPVADR